MNIGKKLVTRTYRIYDKELPVSFSGMRIAFLSDLHGKSHGRGNQELLNRIRDASPHLVLIGGDMVAGGVMKGRDALKTSEASVKTALFLAEKLSERYPVYHAMGNHEEKLKKPLFRVYEEGLRRRKVKLLDNAHVKLSNTLGDSIGIYGFSLGKRLYPKLKREKLELSEMREKLGEKAGEFAILLAHSPLYFDTYAKWGANLTLSGHFHGGVMRLPGIGGVIGPDFFPFPKYAGGRYEKQGRTMAVSCGLWTHSVNVRIFNPPELTLIELHGGEIVHGNRSKTCRV